MCIVLINRLNRSLKPKVRHFSKTNHKETDKINPYKELSKKGVTLKPKFDKIKHLNLRFKKRQNKLNGRIFTAQDSPYKLNSDLNHIFNKHDRSKISISRKVQDAYDTNNMKNNNIA